MMKSTFVFVFFIIAISPRNKTCRFQLIITFLYRVLPPMLMKLSVNYGRLDLTFPTEGEGSGTKSSNSTLTALWLATETLFFLNVTTSLFTFEVLFVFGSIVVH